MSVLIFTQDEDCAGALCAALKSGPETTCWSTALEAARDSARADPPLVLLVDEAVDAGFVDEVLVRRPWTRVRRLSADPHCADPNAIRTPFDAAELAVLIGRDLALARAEQKRFRLQQELEQSERLAAIGRLSASMAHEINNPLAAIVAGIDYVLDAARQSSHDELIECAKDMELAAERIRGFVQHISGYTRREPPTLREGSLSSAIDISLRLVRPRASQRGVQVSVEGDIETRAIHDSARLSQAILNLLANAIDSAAEGGKQVRLQVVPSPGVVTLRIDDDGPGIAPEVADKLFEAFVTTKPPGQGTGLGLAITRQVVQDHDGTITLGPGPQGGARAEICIPALDPRHHRVLVVDQDDVVCRALSADLRREGFEISTARSLAEARERAPGCSVVVTELTLPDGDGRAWLAELMSSQPSIGRIAVSASATSVRVPEAHTTLPKPWRRADLVGAVREATPRQR